MKLLYLVLSSILICNVCYGDRYIQPKKFSHQEEILVNGGTILASDKENSVLMYKTSQTMKKGRGNFYFVLINNSGDPINFYFSNLIVTDQWGRPIRVVHKNELIADKKSTRNVKLFLTALTAGLETINASKAAEVSYASHTNTRYRTNVHSCGSDGWYNSLSSESCVSTTHGTMYCEAFRQQAIRQAERDALERSHSAHAVFNAWDYGLKNYYFDSNTVHPNSQYGANFQIEVPREIEADLEYLLFTYDLDGETHTFRYYCWNDMKNGHRNRL